MFSYKIKLREDAYISTGIGSIKQSVGTSKLFYTQRLFWSVMGDKKKLLKVWVRLENDSPKNLRIYKKKSIVMILFDVS